MQGLILPIILLLMIVWMFYSQRKQQKQREEQMNSIQKGDEIITIGGLHGIIDEIDDKTFVLDCDGVYLTFERFAIRQKVTKAASTMQEKAEKVVEDVTATPVVESAIESADDK